VELAAGEMSRRRVGHFLDKTGDYTALVKDRVDWERARRVASELGVRDKFETFYRLVCMT